MTNTKQNTNTNTQNDITALMFGGLLKSSIHADIDRLIMRKSAWSNGVKQYMHDFIEYDNFQFAKMLKSQNYKEFEQILLNGADSWHDYSWGGYSLVYNYDILERLCPPSVIRKYANCSMINGMELLDIQKRALYQASKKLFNIMFVYSNYTLNDRKNYFKTA